MDDQRLAALLAPLQEEYPYLICAASKTLGGEPIVFLGDELYPDGKDMKGQANNARTFLFLRQAIDSTFKSFYKPETTTT